MQCNVCMYVCLYVMYVCMYVCMYVYMYLYVFALFVPKVTLVCHRTAHAQGTPTQATVNDGTDDSWSEIGCIVVRCCTETTVIFWIL